MKRNTLMTILAMTLALGASRADVLSGTTKPAPYLGLAKSISIGQAGLVAGKDSDEQQKPVQLHLPGETDRARPLLLAPGSGGCVSCRNPFSSWQQFQSALSVLFWI